METKIYTLSHPLTGEVRYVGKTIQPLKKRKIAHIYESKTRNNHRCNWITSLEKQGLKPHIELVEILSPGADWEFWESFWIQTFSSWGCNLVNGTAGGEGRLHSEETKRKISKANSGKNHYQYGVPRSAEVKKKISKTLIGNQHAKGFKHSDETRKKVSENNSKHWLGKKRPEVGDKVSAKLSSPIKQFDKNGRLVKKHKSVRSVLKTTSFDRTGIYKCLSGKQKYCGGFIWKWA